MKTPEEIKKGLEMCGVIRGRCKGCPYDGEAECVSNHSVDALAYIEQLEAAHRTEYCEEADYDCMALGKARKRIAELEAKLAEKNDMDNRMEDE